MLKRIIGALLIVAVLAFVPLIVGCNGDDIRTERHVEVKDKVISQETVIE